MVGAWEGTHREVVHVHLLPHSSLDSHPFSVTVRDKVLHWLGLWNEMEVLMDLFLVDWDFFTYCFLKLLFTAIIHCFKNYTPLRGFRI